VLLPLGSEAVLCDGPQNLRPRKETSWIDGGTPGRPLTILNTLLTSVPLLTRCGRVSPECVAIRYGWQWVEGHWVRLHAGPHRS